MRSFVLPRHAALLSMAAVSFAFWACALPLGARQGQQPRGARATRTDGDDPHRWIDDQSFEAAESAGHADDFSLSLSISCGAPQLEPPQIGPALICQPGRAPASLTLLGRPRIRPPPSLS